MARLILLACQPKSGSTFLCRYLAELGGGRSYSFVPAYGQREQELSAMRLLRARTRIRKSRVLVGQHHVRCSEETLRLIRKFDISVIVLRRNLFDVVASLRDHVRRDDHVGPMFYLNDDMIHMGDHDLEVFLARFAIPWYLNFHMSWRDYKDAISLDYEQIRTDAKGTALGILEAFGLSSVKDAVAPEDVRKTARFNRGVAGRGARIAPEARQIIRDQVETYLRYVDDDYLAQHIA